MCPTARDKPAVCVCVCVCVCVLVYMYTSIYVRLGETEMQNTFYMEHIL